MRNSLIFVLSKGLLTDPWDRGDLSLTLFTDIEWASGMELTLNFGWAMVAVWMLCAWLRVAPRGSADRRVQLVALAVVILILLPAISMTDDLIAAQNPAEVDCCVRRDYSFSSPHAQNSLMAALPAPAFSGLSFCLIHLGAPSQLSAPYVELPALASIQNRPPPAA